MPVLYGCYRSRATRNLWLAEEIGLELELRTVWQAYRLGDPHAADAPLNTESAEFRRIWPFGGIPVLQDGDLVLGESLAINLYLARRYGGELGPRDEAENAQMMQWALFGATEVEEAALAVLNGHGAGTGEGRAAAAKAAEGLRRPLKALEAHLATRRWMVGSRFTVGDINMAEILRYAQADQALIATHPAVDGWLGMCQSRPAFQRFWARREAEPARP